jgi:hypothetical protein
MKINAAAIQSYQQINRQNRPDRPTTEKPFEGAPEAPVTIKPQDEAHSSSLTVKASGSDAAQLLTKQERQAIELLFSRFRDNGRFGPSYSAGADSGESKSPVGQVIDLKA